MELPIHHRHTSGHTSGHPRGHGGSQPARRPRALRLTLAAGALLVAAAAVHWVGPRWLAPPWGEIAGQASPGCDVLRQACQVHFDDGSSAAVQLRSGGAGDMAPLELQVRFNGTQPRSIGIDLDGESMNMGPNHTELSARADGRWSGGTALSACISGRMAWILTLRAPVGGGVRVVRLRFETGTP